MRLPKWITIISDYLKKYKIGVETRKSIQSDLNILKNKMKVLAILLTVVAVALAQDTHYCPDNWELHVRIFLIKHFKLYYQHAYRTPEN